MTDIVHVDVPVPVVPEAPPDAWMLTVHAWLASKRSPATRRWYALDIRQWSKWCDDRSVDPFEARQVTVDTWARKLEDDDLAPKTVARKLSAVASLYKYMVQQGMLEHSPAEHVIRPEISSDHSDTIALDETQLAKLIETAQRRGQRAYVVTLLLGTLGLRSAELLGATVDDLAVDHGTRTVAITRKGAKRKRLPMQGWVSDEVDRLLAGRADGFVIANPLGGRMDYRWLYRLIRSLGRESLGRADVTPHVLRASFATINFDNDTPLHVVQDFMGHADPRTTRLYDKGRGHIERLAKASATVAKRVRPDADLTATEETP